MIYAIYGTDTAKARQKWRAVIDSLLKKRPDVSLFAVDADRYDEGRLEELLAGQTLFDKKYIVALGGVLRTPEAALFVSKRIAEFAEAEHMFVFLEETLSKDLLKLFEKHAFKVEAIDAKKEEAKPAFNPFAVSDALGARDRKRLWIEYQKALRADLADEEIFWKLVWQVKALLSVKTAPRPEDLGMHPFALKKAAGFARNYTEEELLSLSSRLVGLYHLSRRGEVDFAFGLEELVLSV